MRVYPGYLTLSVILTVTLLCYLGYWQLSRAHEKKTLLQQWETRQQHTVLTQEDLLQHYQDETLASWQYTRINLEGSLLDAQSFLLDNQTHQGQVGYALLTPFLLNEQTVILIDRGFLPLGQHRAERPALPPPLDHTPIEGYLDFAYRNPFIDQPTEEEALTWPLRIQKIDFDHVATQINKVVIPMLVKLKTTTPSTPWLTPERHYGYACQWFLLALTLTTLYTLFYFRHLRGQKA